MNHFVITHFKRKASLLAVISAIAMFPAITLAAEGDSEPKSQDDEKKIEVIKVSGRALNSPDMPTATPVVVLTGDDLVHRRQGGLGETLAGLPGVHLDNFGGGASRPVIRGQTMPRIEILSDGANLFDVSSVSPDHAVTTDPLLLDSIEVLRGAAATRYGGSAMNGAINLIDSKIPKKMPAGGLSGATELRYGTGDEEKTAVGRVTAGIGSSFAVHAEGSYRKSDDYNVPKSYGSRHLNDSFADNSSYSLGASWITEQGYIGASYTQQESEYGLPGHSHMNGVCHTHGLDLHCEAHGSYEDPFGSPDSHTAYIKLRSERFDIRADYSDPLPGLSQIRVRGSYTDYAHDEIDGELLFTRYINEVWDGRVEVTHQPVLGFTGVFGVQYTDGTFSGININNMHVPFADNAYGLDGAPDYLTKNTAIFLSETRSFGSVDLEVAARKDWREVSISPPQFRVSFDTTYEELFASWYGAEWRQVLEEEVVGRFVSRNPGSKHNPFSLSVGARWHVAEGYALALSMARTERAPGVRELYARGNNLASNSYELGLAVDNPIIAERGTSAEDIMETSDAINLTLSKSASTLEFEVSLFHQNVDDYVFARLIETEMETGIPHHFLIYTAAKASFSGIDGQISYQLTPASRLTVFGDYVKAKMKSEDDNLPRIPPARVGGRYEWDSGPIAVDLEYYRTFEQDRIASYETKTSGYNMINATFAYKFDVGTQQSAEIYLRGTNLTNELAFSHTSVVKEQSPLRGRNIALGLRYQF